MSLRIAVFTFMFFMQLSLRRCCATDRYCSMRKMLPTSLIKPFIKNELRTFVRFTSSINAKNVVKSALPDIQIPQVPIQEFIFSKTSKWHNKIAAECGVTGRKYTHDEVRMKSINFGKALRKKLELHKGDKVAIMLPNIPEYGICVIGILQGGLVATTVNPLYTAEEISRQLLNSDSKVIIITEISWSVTETAMKNLRKRIPIITIQSEKNSAIPQGSIHFNELINEKCDVHIEPCNPEDTALMPYSSGTTGLPKGVELSHKNITSSITQTIEPQLDLLWETTETYQEVIPVVIPMFHIYGLSSVLLVSMRTGGKLVTLPKFQPDQFLSTLKKYNATFLCVVPPIVRFLSSHPAVKQEHLASVRALSCGAAPLGASDEEKFLQKAVKPISIYQGYGLTETSPTITVNSERRKQECGAAGSVGEPLGSTYVKVVSVDDPTGDALGPNESGELLVKGPQVMKGYHNRPEETNQAFSDGWFRTGDMGYYDINRMFYITDRIKELIKVKGFQVAPAELEDIIREHPHVADAAVIGIPDDRLGEVPRAYVVAKNGKLNIDSLKDYVAKKVVNYKQLAGGAVIVNEIPKNAAGKILKKEIKLRYQNEGI